MPPKSKAKTKIKTKKPKITKKKTIEQKQDVKQTVKVIIGDVEKIKKTRKPREKKQAPTSTSTTTIPPTTSIPQPLRQSQYPSAAAPIPINRLDPNQINQQNLQFDEIKKTIANALKTKTSNLVSQQKMKESEIAADIAQIEEIPPPEPVFVSSGPTISERLTKARKKLSKVLTSMVEPEDSPVQEPATIQPPPPVQEPATIQPPLLQVQEPSPFIRSTNFMEVQTPLEPTPLIIEESKPEPLAAPAEEPTPLAPAEEPAEQLAAEEPASTDTDTDTDDEKGGGGPKIPTTLQFEMDLSDLANFISLKNKIPQSASTDLREKKLSGKLQRFKRNYTLKKGAVMRLKKNRDAYDRFVQQFSEAGFDYPFYLTQQEIDQVLSPEMSTPVKGVSQKMLSKFRGEQTPSSEPKKRGRPPGSSGKKQSSITVKKDDSDIDIV